MQFVSLAIYHCRTVMLQDFEIPSPVFNRFSLYWRDNVMLAGLIASIVGLAGAIITGSMLFSSLYLITSAVILFGMYYVSRYAEMKEMSEQLAAFREQVAALTEQVDFLRNEVDRFQSEVDRLNREITHFEELLEKFGLRISELTSIKEGLERVQSSLENSVERLHTDVGRLNNDLEQIRAEFAFFRNIHQHHEEVLTQYRAVLRELQEAQAKFADIQKQIEINLIKDAFIKESIRIEVERLQAVSKKLEDTTNTSH